jgi:hypothetical protein
MKLAQAELKARGDRLALQVKSQPVATANVNVLAQKQAALQKQQTVRQAALLEQVRSKIPVQAYQEMSQRIALGTAASGVPLKQKTGVAVRATGTSAQADVSNAGSNAPRTIAPDPAIASLSVTSGQPGDPVLITGSGFSNDPEVHFIVANGKDVVAPVTIWSDIQIFAAVPEVSGIQAFNGQVYVKRGTSKSQLVPFRFNPAIEVRLLQRTNDTDVEKACLDKWSLVVKQERFGSFFGARGDDQFFLSTWLKNGWTVDAAYLTGFYLTDPVWHLGNADAYVSEFRQGTDSPYVKVHWWVDAFSAVVYNLYVVISGPKDVPNF